MIEDSPISQTNTIICSTASMEEQCFESYAIRCRTSTVPSTLALTIPSSQRSMTKFCGRRVMCPTFIPINRRKSTTSSVNFGPCSTNGRLRTSEKIMNALSTLATLAPLPSKRFYMANKKPSSCNDASRPWLKLVISGRSRMGDGCLKHYSPPSPTKSTSVISKISFGASVSITSPSTALLAS